MNKPATKLYRLEVSRYERVAGMLLALLVLLGLIVVVMAIVWLTNRIFVSQAAVPVTMEELGSDEAPWGPGDDIEPPAGEETDLVEEEIEDVLEAVTDAVASRAALIQPGGAGEGTGGGGTGRGRKGKPRRWELMFNKGNTVETYAAQLDFFKIELGVLMPDNRVEYAFNLVRSRPSRRTGRADQEKRYYLTWRQGELQEADRTLLSRAGITVGRSPILKFLPPKVEAALQTLEQTQAAGKAVRTTRFGVRPGSNSDYEFYVLKQTYR